MRATEPAVRQREHLVQLGHLSESDLEDEIAERLEEVGVAGAQDRAPVFATAGMDARWVDEVVEQVGSGLERSAAFGWLRCTLGTETLMDEIEEAATRISSLVGAVKQYSHPDQAQHQDLDVEPGLESTLVILARELSGIPVQREHAADLPAVPG